MQGAPPDVLTQNVAAALQAFWIAMMSLDRSTDRFHAES